jgi:hypothetical protein
VNPGQQVRVSGRVPASVWGDAIDAFMNELHGVDDGESIEFGAKCGDANKLGRLVEATEGIFAVGRKLSHAGHREWVRHLQEERGEPSNEHGGQVNVQFARRTPDGHVGRGGVVARWRRFLVDTNSGADSATGCILDATSEIVHRVLALLLGVL